MVKIAGKGVGLAFQHEAGKHCCQRVPVTESGGRVHTSMVSVAVLPLQEKVDHPLGLSDLEITTQGGHGPGGQHQNKTDSAVRAKHIPTGLEVFINGKHQNQNKKEAIRILTARVNNLKQAEADNKYGQSRKSQMKGGKRSDKTRTYNFKDSRVVDHALNKKSKQIKKIMKGNLDLLFKN